MCGDFNIGEIDSDWNGFPSNDNSIQNFLELIVEIVTIQGIKLKTVANGTWDEKLVSKNFDYLSYERTNY